MKKTPLLIIFILMLTVLIVVLCACVINEEKGKKSDKKTYTVVVTGGSGSGTYEEDSTVVIVADSIDGKEFSYWRSNGQSISSQSTFSFVINNDWILEAIFQDKIIYCDIATDDLSKRNGYVEGLGKHVLGSEVTLKAIQLKYGTFLYWKSEEEIISYDNPFIFTAKLDIVLEPIYEYYPLGMSFLYNLETQGYTITDFLSSYPPANITLPRYYDDGINGVKPVMGIGDNAFSKLNDKGISSVIINEGVEKIGKHAFGINTLKNIHLPESLKIIGDFCFSGCSVLEEIYLPKNVEELGEEALKASSSLKNIVVDSENRFFSDLDGILFDKDKKTLIFFPDGKNYRDNHYEIPATVTSIGTNAFSGSLKIEKVSFNQDITITAIGSYAFYKTNLKSINIPKSIKSINDYAFYQNNFTEVKFEDGSELEFIGAGAFDYCKNLKKINLPEGLTEIGESAFASCDSLWEIVLPSTLKHIRNNAFANCTILYRITVMDGIESIGENAFVECNLHNINVYSKYIASGITSENVFGGMFKKATHISIGNKLIVTDYVVTNYQYTKQYENYKTYSKYNDFN